MAISILNGTVYDGQNGQAVENARVYWDFGWGFWVRVAKTDPGGNYSDCVLDGVPQGASPQKLGAMKVEGNRVWIKQFTKMLSDGPQQNPVNIYLEELTNEELKTQLKALWADDPPFITSLVNLSSSTSSVVKG